MPSLTPAEIVTALKAEGIDCQQHDLGLAAYAADPVAYVRELHKIDAPRLESVPRPSRRVCHGYANCCACTDCTARSDARLNVVTMGKPSPPEDYPHCSHDAMTCQCPDHASSRLQAIRRGPLGAGPAAFAVRPARRAA